MGDDAAKIYQVYQVASCLISLEWKDAIFVSIWLRIQGIILLINHTDTVEERSLLKEDVVDVEFNINLKSAIISRDSKLTRNNASRLSFHIYTIYFYLSLHHPPPSLHRLFLSRFTKYIIKEDSIDPQSYIAIMATPSRRSRSSVAPTPASAVSSRRVAPTSTRRPSAAPTASTTASRASTSGSAALPIYQAPSCAMNETAIVSLRQLHNRVNLDPLKKHLAEASSLLSTSASEVLDRYQARSLKPRSSQESDGTAERTLELKADVERVLAVLEAETRRTIDAQARVEAGEASLKKLASRARHGDAVVASTQSTLGASQFRQSRRTQCEEDEHDGSDAEATPSQPALGGTKTQLDKMMAEWEANWEAKSLSTRLETHLFYRVCS